MTGRRCRQGKRASDAKVTISQRTAAILLIDQKNSPAIEVLLRSLMTVSPDKGDKCGVGVSSSVWFSALLGACLASGLTRTESWKIPVACLLGFAIAALAPLFAEVDQPPIFQFLTASVVMALIGGSFEISPRQLVGGMSGAFLLGIPVLLWTL
jgi:hypothetical protein